MSKCTAVQNEMQHASRSLPRSPGISSLPHKMRPSSIFSCPQRSSRYLKAPHFYSHVNIKASVAKGEASSSPGSEFEIDDLHRLAYNKTFEFFQVKVDNELVEWAGPYYDTLVHDAEGGKLRWHFSKNTWPTFSIEGGTFGEIESANCVEVQDELIVLLQDKKTELYNDIISRASKSERELQLIARIQNLEKQLKETAEASSRELKEMQTELEARMSGSLSEALPTEQSSELRAQIRRLEVELAESPQFSSEELADFEAQTVARIQTKVVEEQLQNVQPAEPEPNLVELEETSKLRALVRQLELEMADMITRDELKLEEAKVLALKLDMEDE